MPTSPLLTSELLSDALGELGQLARDEGMVIDVAVYGGAALLMVSNFRMSTKDVDAVADDEGQRVIERLANQIALRRGWTNDWLNDEVFGFLSESIEGVEQHHHYFRSYPSEQEPGLRVFVPTPEYLLAMKLMAMRIGGESGTKDRDDIISLLGIVGLTSRDATLEFVVGFYPDAKKSSKVVLGIDELFSSLPLNPEAARVLAPTYLGRCGPAD